LLIALSALLLGACRELPAHSHRLAMRDIGDGASTSSEERLAAREREAARKARELRKLVAVMDGALREAPARSLRDKTASQKLQLLLDVQRRQRAELVALRARGGGSVAQPTGGDFAACLQSCKGNEPRCRRECGCRAECAASADAKTCQSFCED
jgi:hypothetical protein